tara:strand:- start:797 stop:991 length:195 start_codon:yes stop_codon:yes gene_type:complete
MFLYLFLNILIKFDLNIKFDNKFIQAKLYAMTGGAEGADIRRQRATSPKNKIKKEFILNIISTQ